jgi:hypothetical protein
MELVPLSRFLGVKMSKEEKSIGAKVVELAQKNPDFVVSKEEIEASGSRREKEFFFAVDKGCAQYIGPFFIEIRFKLETILLGRVIKSIFTPKGACPRPEYDHTVYRIDPDTNEIRLLWCIPKKETCLFVLQHGKIATTHYGIHEDLVRDIQRFEDKTLGKLCHKLNGEIKEDNLNPNFKPEDWDFHENHVVQRQNTKQGTE